MLLLAVISSLETLAKTCEEQEQNASMRSEKGKCCVESVLHCTVIGEKLLLLCSKSFFTNLLHHNHDTNTKTFLPITWYTW